MSWSIKNLAAGMVLFLLATAASPAAISPDDPASVQTGIVAAAQKGQKTVVVPPGVYKIAPGRSGWHLRFADLSDLTIQADGAVFLWQGRTEGGIEFAHCKNVTLQGATLRHEVMPFTQGKIVAIGAEKRTLDVRIDAGYPAEFDDPRYFPANPVGYIFDPSTRQWKTGTVDCYCERAERLDAGLFRLHVGGNHAKDPIEVDDLMAFRGKGRQDVHLADCENVALDGVTIQNGGGFCVHESSGPGGNHYRFRLTYGPRPTGATSDPLIACNADAFHSSGVRKGPSWRAVPSRECPTTASPSTATTSRSTAARGTCSSWAPWAAPPCSRPATRSACTTTRASRLARRSSSRSTSASDRKPSGASKLRAFQGRTLHYFALTLDKPLAAGFDSLAANPALCGAGFIAQEHDPQPSRPRHVAESR